MHLMKCKKKTLSSLEGMNSENSSEIFTIAIFFGNFCFFLYSFHKRYCTLVFQAGTAKTLSLTDYGESKNKMATPKWKINLFLLGTIFLGDIFLSDHLNLSGHI